MERTQHHIQDACEIYAVAMLSQLAAKAGRGSYQEARELDRQYQNYLHERGLTEAKIRKTRYVPYILNIQTHIPEFFARLINKHPTGDLRFELVEVEARAAKKKADFALDIGNSRFRYEVSLKNYLESVKRPQVCSGTFNSFILNMLFTSPGVGTFRTLDGQTFRGSSREDRDLHLVRRAGPGILNPIKRLDKLNDDMRAQFLGPHFEYLDESTFKREQKSIGEAGRDICYDILTSLPLVEVRNRITEVAGLDGAEEMLYFDPKHCFDSITGTVYSSLIQSIGSPSTSFSITKAAKQSLDFDYWDESGSLLLKVKVPFTVNKNGAWISDKTFKNAPRFHKKEGLVLEFGQRRPKKSREIATSVNTYVELGKAGVFG